ncbi:MAG: prolyl oligopeptidase family serine peptidase [Alphaproteobacteria bacterium]|nr:prolyl oligopeptidase family serine peptidase [Alphaproteobacteria bacterium]
MTTIRLEGPTAQPASGRAARQLVVLLHGVGADGDDLIGLAPYFAQVLPDAAFASPHAPFPYDMAPFGRQWFSLADRSPQAIARGVRAAAPILDAFLDESLAALGLDDDALALVGFSQGTMMALHVAMRRPRRMRAVLGYSGMLADPAALPAEITARPRTLLIHGEADDVVAPTALAAATAALEAVGVPVTAHAEPNLGHGLSDQGIAMGMAFLAQAFLDPT